MMPSDPTLFARQWIDAWNARDVEAVLVHYADDVVFTSPTALRVVPDSRGTVRGKDALRSYWISALAGSSDLRFELIAVYSGIATIVIQYQNQSGGTVSEVLTFENGLVSVGHATHMRDWTGDSSPR